MYINRKPLGQGGPHFRGRGPSFPYFRATIYVAILLGALYVYSKIDELQPVLLERLGPTPTATPTVGEVLAEANSSYDEGDLQATIVSYREALLLEPDNIDHHVALARLLLLDDQLEAGLEQAEQAILADPESPKGYAIKSMALDWSRSPEEAVVAAFKSIEIDPEYAPARAYLAEAYVDLGRWTQAREQAELAIALDPFNVDARRNYAYLLEFVGDYEGAIAQYEQALTISPNLLHLQYGLARNHRAAGNPEQAISAFTAIIERNPEDPEPWLEIGKTYFEMREDNAAEDNFRQAIELVCDECPLYNSDEVLADSFVNISRDLPDEIYMPAWVRLGQVQFTRRNYESSLEVLEEAIAWGETNDEAVPIEAYYVSALAYYYLDLCNRAVPRAFDGLALYEENRMEEESILNNILGTFVLCRDYANTPYAVTFPEIYEEPNVIVERP